MEISREEYEELIQPLLHKTMDSVHACLKDALLLPKAIDKIILVGGTTRTPLVSRMLEEEMGIEPRHEINPELIVAMGASVQGAAIGGEKTRAILVDITPYTFGTRAIDESDGMFTDDAFIPVIKRNSPLPISKEEVFCTCVDNQESVLVEIYQGEASIASENIFIGDFNIKGLSRAKSGNLVLLNLELDVNGILKVTAKEKITGLFKTVIMDTTKTDIAPNLKEKFGNIDLLQEERETQDDRYTVQQKEMPDKNTLISRAKELRKRAEAMMSGVNEEDAAELSLLLDSSRQAISTQEWEVVDKLNESLTDMLFYLED